MSSQVSPNALLEFRRIFSVPVEPARGLRVVCFGGGTGLAKLLRGPILPASSVAAQLGAEMRDGSFVVGECAITNSRAGVRRVQLIPADTPAVPETLAAIAEADVITLGPGSLYTSLVPNLLVPGI